MEAAGLITKSKEANDKGPDRILYCLSDSGREELRRWLGNGNEKEYVKYEILLKLFFGSALPAEQNIQMIREFRERSLANLQMMTLFSDNLLEVINESKDHRYYYLTTLFGAHTYQAYIDWADEAIRVLEKPEDPS